ncbi:MAG: hypothetical protein E6G77_23340 [Alphaproteobacteria bacterium]|nr:MAG: hypothetical protein E6G77_23340 [Alphaproteobacteria bacterium]
MKTVSAREANHARCLLTEDLQMGLSAERQIRTTRSNERITLRQGRREGEERPWQISRLWPLASSAIHDHVKVDPELHRPSDIMCSKGDARKAYNVLGWKSTCTMPDAVRMMVHAELNEHKGAPQLSPHSSSP